MHPNTEGMGLEIQIETEIEELELKIAPDDNGETVLPLPPGRKRH